MLFPALPAPMIWLATLVALFIVKHVIADFLLQTRWMASGKERERGWVTPLAAHAAVHGLLTGVIAVAVAPPLAWLAAVDVAVHAAVDRSKSIAGRVLRVEPYGGRFWWLIGIDQALHQLTHLAFALMLAAAATGG